MINQHKLRKLRITLGWTQGYAAKQIGIQQSYLSKLENGQAIPSSEILEAISNVYQCDFNDIAPNANLEHIKSQLTSNTKVKLTPKYSLLYLTLLLSGILLLALSIFGIYQSNTAYTYQLESQQDILAPTFLVVDEYYGEKYIVRIKQTEVLYLLIGERDITPFINRVLAFMGSLLIFCSILSAFFHYLYLKQAKKTRT